MALPSFAQSVSPSNGGESRILSHLEQARGAIEGRFLEVGDVLSRIVDGANVLIDSLDRTRERLTGDTVRAATNQLTDASMRLRSLPESLRERRDRIGDLMRAGGDLTVHIEDMRQHLAYLRVFGVNIKITSGGIAAAGPEFAIFAQEICDCIELGRGQLDTFRADLAKLDEVLSAAVAHEERLRRRCEELVPAIPDALVSEASAVSAHQATVAEISSNVGELARGLRKKIGAVLGALQIGDITRQRIEHVQHGLGLLETFAEAQALPAEARGRLEGFMRRLLAAQLAATTRDFETEVSRIGHNVSAIAGDADQIMRLRDHAQGRASDGEGSFLAGLEASLVQASALVQDIDAGERLAEEVSRSAASAARALATQIQAIQNMRADVQMMALNTTLKCARIGETGKPLGVIAIELRQHAGHLETSAARTLAALEGLSMSAGASGGRDGAGGATLVAEALQSAVEHFRSTGEEIDGDLAAAAREGEGVVDLLRRAVARFDFHGHVGSYLDKAASELAAAGADNAPVDDLMPVLGPMLQSLARTYTMVQEREVHASMTADLGEMPEPAAPAVLVDDDVLF
ncbi:hypothetical protein [Caulobacter sp. 3R27C2-B]|uniref:hypothetical protein n=2 Tax=Caulobacter TaxID=75 RepID=UPI000784A1C1|nr:hypothetical protein [Caulobacter sp. 3R27C2-B]AZS20747.1 hypothetical protein CSW63_08880 [Caulobacter sp. FWC26]